MNEKQRKSWLIAIGRKEDDIRLDPDGREYILSRGHSERIYLPTEDEIEPSI